MFTAVRIQLQTVLWKFSPTLAATIIWRGQNEGMKVLFHSDTEIIDVTFQSAERRKGNIKTMENKTRDVATTVNERSNLIIAPTETISHVSDADFHRNAIVMIISLLILLSVFGFLATLSTVIVWVLGIFATFLVLFTLMVLHGFYIWNRGSLPPVQDKEGKHIEVGPDNRVVEYFVWGSEKEDATPLVVLHGSGSTGKYLNQCAFPADVLIKMNVKAYSPSFPGHGGSDVHRYRRIADWPMLDLVPILEREKVDKFIVIGTSYGTAHAMAVASALPDRCLALGLNAPYLPEFICREAKLWTDADMILREKQLEKPWFLLPALSFLSLTQHFVASALKLYPEGKLVAKELPAIIEALGKDATRAFLRGVNGQVYEMMNAETTQTWPDPREIKVKNIAVWYGGDDGIVPPEHGQWLAENLATEDRNVNVKCDKSGYGHFTYLTPEHCETGVMTQTLLDMISSEKKQ